MKCGNGDRVTPYYDFRTGLTGVDKPVGMDKKGTDAGVTQF